MRNRTENKSILDIYYKALGITQKELAEQMGVNYNTLATWKRRVDDWEKVMKLLDVVAYERLYTPHVGKLIPIKVMYTNLRNKRIIQGDKLDGDTVSVQVHPNHRFNRGQIVLGVPIEGVSRVYDLVGRYDNHGRLLFDRDEAMGKLKNVIK